MYRLCLPLFLTILDLIHDELILHWIVLMMYILSSFLLCVFFHMFCFLHEKKDSRVKSVVLIFQEVV